MFCAEYIELIKKTINEVAKEYQNNNEVDAMKMKIRSSSLCYARQKKNKMSSKENYLEEKITYLQKRLDKANVSAMVNNSLGKPKYNSSTERWVFKDYIVFQCLLSLEFTHRRAVHVVMSTPNSFQ